MRINGIEIKHGEVLNCLDRHRKLYLEPFCYILNIDGQRYTFVFT